MKTSLGKIACPALFYIRYYRKEIMGQYYKPLCLDNLEYLYSHSYKDKITAYDGREVEVGVGLKLMEQSYIGNQLMNAVERLLIPGRRWYKKRIVWAGDYADPELVDGKENPEENDNLYSRARRVIHPSDRRVNKKYHYLLNHSKRVVIDLDTIIADKDGFRIHPLSLLTAEGNGRGGGDFHGEDERIGSWSRDIISLEDKVPEDYQLFNGQFTEE